MEVHEGDKIVFEVNNIVKSLEYQLVIRYEPQLTKAWDDVRITLTRPQPVNQNGPCSNTIPQVWEGLGFRHLVVGSVGLSMSDV